MKKVEKPEVRLEIADGLFAVFNTLEEIDDLICTLYDMMSDLEKQIEAAKEDEHTYSHEITIDVDVDANKASDDIKKLLEECFGGFHSCAFSCKLKKNDEEEEEEE